jgi:dolichol-phosphate mannosyltransferase
LTDATHATSVTVVTPTYDEAGNLRRHVESVLAQGPEYRLIIVDDASPDGTGDLADSMVTGAAGRLDVIRRPAKAGLASAYVAGIRRALRYEPRLIVLMDADGSHDPADLPRLVAAAGASDVVLGSRYCPGGQTPGWPLWRRLLSRMGGRYAAAVLGLAVADPTSGYRVMRRSAVGVIDLDAIRASGFAVNLELTWRFFRSGCRLGEEPIAFLDRLNGRSKLTPVIALEAAILVWRLRFAGAKTQCNRKNRSAAAP